jgi:hypothetical protein
MSELLRHPPYTYDCHTNEKCMLGLPLSPLNACERSYRKLYKGYCLRKFGDADVPPDYVLIGSSWSSGIHGSWHWTEIGES